jgi:hypothetical protein
LRGKFQVASWPLLKHHLAGIRYPRALTVQSVAHAAIELGHELINILTLLIVHIENASIPLEELRAVPANRGRLRDIG